MSEKVPRVSIIMRSKNAETVIGQALVGTFSQDFREFELIVVDSGSTDRTLEIVSAYPHHLIRIEPTDYFPGRVLNQAIRESRGEILVFQNSDTVPLTTGTLGRLLAAFDDPEVQASFARQLPRPDADAWVRRDYAVSFPDADEAPEWIPLSLPLAAIRRTAWERHPFYTDAWGSEDVEWGAWARQQDWKIAYVRDALVMHSHNYTLRQLYGRRFIEGEADAFIYHRKEGFSRMFVRALFSISRDLVACARAGDWLDLPAVPARRIVYHWAYLKGHRFGTRRLLAGDTDASVGQRTVLSRHDSKR